MIIVGRCRSAAAGRIFKIGHQPINANIAAYYNVVTPDDTGANWQLRSLPVFHAREFAIIKGKTKGVSECRKGSFCGVSLCSFRREFMRFPG